MLMGHMQLSVADIGILQPRIIRLWLAERRIWLESWRCDQDKARLTIILDYMQPSVEVLIITLSEITRPLVAERTMMHKASLHPSWEGAQIMRPVTHPLLAEVHPTRPVVLQL